MDYKKLMGYGDKKKVTKKQPKPKVNKVLESIKEEFNIKEVGAAAEYRPHIKKIEKLYDAYWDSVKDFQKVLDKKGLKGASKGIGNAYINLVVKFHKLFGKIVKKLL